MAPIFECDPGYAAHPAGDHDGIACESYRQAGRDVTDLFDDDLDAIANRLDAALKSLSAGPQLVAAGTEIDC